jgi:hypothetical protein
VPKGIIATAAFYGFLGFCVLVFILTAPAGLSMFRLFAALAVIGLYVVMIVAATTPHPSAWLAFVILQWLLGAAELVMCIIRLAGAGGMDDVKAALFIFGRVLVYALILIYYMRPDVKEFYGRAEVETKTKS